MPHNLITEQMEVRFKEFIEQARMLFEEAADNALKSIRSANKVKEISTWHHDSMLQVAQVLKELEEKKSLDSVMIYEFATSKKQKIEQQLATYANELERYVAFRASFTPMQLRKIIAGAFGEVLGETLFHEETRSSDEGDDGGSLSTCRAATPVGNCDGEILVISACSTKR